MQGHWTYRTSQPGHAYKRVYVEKGETFNLDGHPCGGCTATAFFGKVFCPECNAVIVKGQCHRIRRAPNDKASELFFNKLMALKQERRAKSGEPGPSGEQTGANGGLKGGAAGKLERALTALKRSA